MKIVSLLLTLATVATSNAKDKTFKAICGKAGVGKSYIFRLLGCDNISCDGTESCTKNAKICEDFIDTVGLDDDGKYTVPYKGSYVSLSGLTYPIYNLFAMLEAEKINQVEFYLVYDTNIMRDGTTSQFFKEFLADDLQCPYTRILNKFRAGRPAHEKLKEPTDLVISEDQTTPVELKGQKCSFALKADWRERVFMSDLDAIKSKITPENCNMMVQRKKEFIEIMKMDPVEIDQRDCAYEAITGYYQTGGSSGSFLGIISWSRSGETIPIKERKSDEECAKIRAERNKAIGSENDRIHEQRLALLKTIGEIDKGLAECKVMLANWEEVDQI